MMSFSDKNDKSQNEELQNRLKELENKFDKDNEKKDIIKKLKDNLNNLEFSGPETDMKKIKKDLVQAIVQLLSWI
jgi:predicted RNase H-like nuclease (RuvC/YqgF family)